jgi:hypothetical protein
MACCHLRARALSPLANDRAVKLARVLLPLGLNLAHSAPNAPVRWSRSTAERLSRRDKTPFSPSVGHHRNPSPILISLPTPLALHFSSGGEECPSVGSLPTTVRASTAAPRSPVISPSVTSFFLPPLYSSTHLRDCHGGAVGVMADAASCFPSATARRGGASTRPWPSPRFLYLPLFSPSPACEIQQPKWSGWGLWHRLGGGGLRRCARPPKGERATVERPHRGALVERPTRDAHGVAFPPVARVIFLPHGVQKTTGGGDSGRWATGRVSSAALTDLGLGIHFPFDLRLKLFFFNSFLNLPYILWFASNFLNFLDQRSISSYIPLGNAVTGDPSSLLPLAHGGGGDDRNCLCGGALTYPNNSIYTLDQGVLYHC